MPRQLLITTEQQRLDERVAYSITLDATYTSPSTPVCVLYDLTDNTDVSLSKLSGSPAINGQVFTTPLVISLVAGRTYRLECKFSSGGNTFEPYITIVGVE